MKYDDEYDDDDDVGIGPSDYFLAAFIAFGLMAGVIAVGLALFAFDRFLHL